MRLRVLGCSGGIGGRQLRTTSFLVDGDILLDAGSGVGDLSLAELTRIDHVFVTHSHLDHVTSIPFLIDTVGGMRSKPITVHATAATTEILRNHLFNWSIWPDFSEIPTPEAPFMRYAEVELGHTVTISGRAFTPLPANHTVPAVGYHLDSGKGGDHRDGVFQQGEAARGNFQALVPVHAGRRAAQARARRRHLGDASQAR
jgi:ribonuclease BN (tRNA processing enzyme)